MSTIFIDSLTLDAKLGVYEHEQGIVQAIALDIEVATGQVARAARSEALADTTDYEILANTAREVVAQRHFPLVETLATAVAEALLELPAVERARVRIHKLGCFAGVAAAGVEVELERQQQRPQRPLRMALDTLAGVGDLPVVVVGAGAAGLAAALWTWRLGHPAVLIERLPQLGGQLQLVHFRMFDLPGLPALSGAELTQRLYQQLPPQTRLVQAELAAIELATDSTRLALHDPDGRIHNIAASAVILAMGLRRRALGASGEGSFQGRGILETASKGLSALAKQSAVVIGGGDAACENALKLACFASEVHLVYRRAELSARAEFRQRVLAHPRIKPHPERRVLAFEGSGQLEAVRLDTGETLDARWALVRVGWLPNSTGLPARWLDEGGYVRCEPNLQVQGAPGVFVAGDLRRPAAFAVASAIGDGACAASSALQWLERP